MRSMMDGRMWTTIAAYLCWWCQLSRAESTDVCTGVTPKVVLTGSMIPDVTSQTPYVAGDVIPYQVDVALDITDPPLRNVTFLFGSEAVWPEASSLTSYDWGITEALLGSVTPRVTTAQTSNPDLVTWTSLSDDNSQLRHLVVDTEATRVQLSATATFIVSPYVPIADQFLLDLAVNYIHEYEGVRQNCTLALSSAPLYSNAPQVTLLNTFDRHVAVGRKTLLKLSMLLPVGQLPNTQGGALLPTLGTEPQATVTHLWLFYIGGAISGALAGSDMFRSTERWTRHDMGLWHPGDEPLVCGPATSPDQRRLTFAIEARLEDFADVTNGSEVWLGAAFRVSEQLLFAAQGRTEAVLEHMRRPRMKVHSVRHYSQHSRGDDHQITSKFSLSHESQDSTAYCRNATLYWYFLPNVTLRNLGGTTHVRSGGVHMQQISPNIAQIVVDTVMFSDTAEVTFTFSHLAVDLHRITTYVALVDLVYYFDDDGQSRYYMWDRMTHMSLRLNVNYKPPDPPACHCIPGNITSGECACCAAYECACGVLAPGRCYMCDQMWRCTDYIDGHRQQTRYIDEDGAILCNYKRLEVRGGYPSCFYQSTAESQWNEVNALLGTLLGRDTEDGAYYGTGNSGQSCVRSYDVIDWTSLPCEHYFRARTTLGWREAERIDIEDGYHYATRNGFLSSENLVDQCNITLMENLQNGDCEDDVNITWDFLPRNPGEGYLLRNASLYHVTGAQSCEIFGQGGVMQQTIQRAPQTDVLSLTVYSKTMASCMGANCYIFIHALDDRRHQTSSVDTPIPIVSGWQEVKVIIRLHENVTSLEVGASFWPTTGSVFFDNFRLKSYTDPEPNFCFV